MKMKLHLIPILVMLMLTSGLVAGCEQQTRPVTTPTTSTAIVSTKTQADTPILQDDEACTLVYNYLEDKATAMTDITQRMVTLDLLSEARPYFVANYQGNGKWQVWALSIGEINWTYNGGLWNLYETSRVIEPANDQATKLLSYIQSFTTSTTPTTSPEPIPTLTTMPTWLFRSDLILMSQDGTYLGKVNGNKVSPESIMNPIGRYGSQVSSTSIWSEVSKYGSLVSKYSAFNEIAGSPPMILSGDEFIIYVTTSKLKTPRIHPLMLKAWLDEKGY